MRAFNGQRYFATPLPRRNPRLLLASRPPREEARSARASLSASRRRDSSVGACVRTRSLVRGHAPASLPWSLSAYPTACRGDRGGSLSLSRASQLFFPRQASPMQRDALAWYNAMHSLGVRARLLKFTCKDYSLQRFLIIVI